MKTSEQLNIASQIIQIAVFLFFSIKLIIINALDLIDLIISAFAILMGLTVSIISAIEKLRGV